MGVNGGNQFPFKAFPVTVETPMVDGSCGNATGARLFQATAPGTLDSTRQGRAG